MQKVFIIICFLSFCLINVSCDGSKKNDSVSDKEKMLEIVKEKGIEIYPGAEFIAVNKTKTVGKVLIYKYQKQEGLYKKLVDYYHNEAKKAKLFGGLPFDKKILLNGTKLIYKGAGGQDFSHTVAFYISKPENNLDHIKMLVEVDW